MIQSGAVGELFKMKGRKGNVSVGEQRERKEREEENGRGPEGHI